MWWFCLFALKFDYIFWIERTFGELDDPGDDDDDCWDDDDDFDYISWIDRTFGKLDHPCDDDDDQGQQLGKSEVVLHLHIMMIIL